MVDGYGSAPDKSPEKGDSRVKSKKKKMCPNQLSTGTCTLFKSHKCSYAHNPIELDLIPIETKMKNLQGVIQSQT